MSKHLPRSGAGRCVVSLVLAMAACGIGLVAGCGSDPYKTASVKQLRLDKDEQKSVRSDVGVEIVVGSAPDFYTYLHRHGLTITFCEAAARVCMARDQVMVQHGTSTSYETWFMRWQQHANAMLLREARRRQAELYYSLALADHLRATLPNGRVYVSMADDDAAVEAFRKPTSATSMIPNGGLIHSHRAANTFSDEGWLSFEFIEACMLGAGMVPPRPSTHAVLAIDVAVSPGMSLKQTDGHAWGDRLAVVVRGFDREGNVAWTSTSLKSSLPDGVPSLKPLDPETLDYSVKHADFGDAWWAAQWNEGGLPSNADYRVAQARNGHLFRTDRDAPSYWGSFKAQRKPDKKVGKLPKNSAAPHDSFDYVMARFAHDLAVVAEQHKDDQIEQTASFVAAYDAEAAKDTRLCRQLASGQTPTDVRGRALQTIFAKEREVLGRIEQVLLKDFYAGEFGDLFRESREEERTLVRQYDSSRRWQSIQGTMGVAMQSAALAGGTMAAFDGDVQTSTQFANLSVQTGMQNLQMQDAFNQANAAMENRAVAFAETMAGLLGPVEIQIGATVERVEVGDLGSAREKFKALYDKVVQLQTGSNGGAS